MSIRPDSQQLVQVELGVGRVGDKLREGGRKSLICIRRLGWEEAGEGTCGREGKSRCIGAGLGEGHGQHRGDVHGLLRTLASWDAS